MSAAETRDRICEAALRVANRDGLLAMTLDKVAKEAEVSKGGVMYHFRSKDELIRGVLEYFCGQCESMLIREAADDAEPRMRWARCLVKCMFPAELSAAGHESDSGERIVAAKRPGNQLPLSSEVLARFMLATLTAAVNKPDAMEPIREIAVRLRTRMLSDPADGIEQLLVWLAIDGLFLWQFMGLISADDPLMSQLAEALRRKVAPEAER